jgi:hypothetical protein
MRTSSFERAIERLRTGPREPEIIVGRVDAGDRFRAQDRSDFSDVIARGRETNTVEGGKEVR